MKTTALRMYDKFDLRLESFDLPAIGEDEILAEVVCDSICMSSYKAAKQGADHKRVPEDIATRPVIIGHEFTGKLLQVGARWADRFQVGDRFGIQPALNYQGTLDAPGYSFPFLGGDATHVIIPSCVMESDCLLNYEGDAWFKASLAEPMSCIVGACKAQFHVKRGTYEHQMGIRAGGVSAVLAGAGPMGLGFVDYLVHGPRQPRLLIVTDIDQARLDRAASIISPEQARASGVELRYVNTRTDNPVQDIMDLTDGHGVDDIFVLAPVAPVIEQGDQIKAEDACINFFAGPTDPNFSAKLNFFDVHYSGSHVVGTTGGNTEDMRDSLALMGAGKINPASMITHVGGLSAAKDTTIGLPDIPGGKKLLYTQVDLPLVAIDDFAAKGAEDPFYARLAEACAAHKGLWNKAAEEIVLAEAPKIS